LLSQTSGSPRLQKKKKGTGLGTAHFAYSLGDGSLIVGGGAGLQQERKNQKGRGGEPKSCKGMP